ncbi:MAG: transporter [Candidatus Omnitrophica bacterium]|nr:transporter [Candidatus Omnitrophota bacterium]
MLRSSLFILAALSLLFLGVSVSYAEDEWNPVSAGPVSTWTAPLCGKGKFVTQPFLFYNRTRGTFNEKGHYNPLDNGNRKYQYQEQLFAQYGITDQLEIDVQTVYQENYVKNADGKAHSDGFGDSYIFMKYCLHEEKDNTPHIAALFQVKVPTGKYEHENTDKLGTDLMGATSGGGSWDQGLGLIFTKKVKPFMLHADAAYSFPQKVRVNGVKTRYANYLNYDFGLEYFLPKGLNLMLEANGFLQGDKRENGAKISASDIKYFMVVPGIGWSNDKFQTLLSYQRVAIGTNTDANDAIVLTCVYTF